MSVPEANARGGLKACINAPGGISMREAISRADLHLEVLRENTVTVIADCLASIAALNAEINGAPTLERRKQMHELSCTLAALGGIFQREGLSKAAYSFCRLIDATEPGWDVAAAAVHVNTMRLMFAPDGVPAEMQAALIEGLLKVRRCAVALKPPPE